MLPNHCPCVGTWGGARHYKFTIIEQVIAEYTLLALTKVFKHFRRYEYYNELQRRGINVSTQWITRDVGVIRFTISTMLMYDCVFTFCTKLFVCCTSLIVYLNFVAC